MTLSRMIVLMFKQSVQIHYDEFDEKSMRYRNKNKGEQSAHTNNQIRLHCGKSNERYLFRIRKNIYKKIHQYINISCNRIKVE